MRFITIIIFAVAGIVDTIIIWTRWIDIEKLVEFVLSTPDPEIRVIADRPGDIMDPW